jgi:hypothetical protein
MLNCATPNCDSERNNHNDHCDYHHDLFHPLYLKYKKQGSRLNEANIDASTSDIYQLLNYYARVKEIYETRSEYRSRAFQPKYRDEGNQHQINIT